MTLPTSKNAHPMALTQPQGTANVGATPGLMKITQGGGQTTIGNQVAPPWFQSPGGFNLYLRF